MRSVQCHLPPVRWTVLFLALFLCACVTTQSKTVKDAVSTKATKISIEPLGRGMALMAYAPHITDEPFIIVAPKAIGCREGLLLNAFEPADLIHWEGPDSDGVLKAGWSPGGRIWYRLTLTPLHDTIDIEITIGNSMAVDWHDVYIFTALSARDVPMFQDPALTRSYLSHDGSPTLLNEVKHHKNIMSTFLHEDYMHLDRQYLFTESSMTDCDITDDAWIAVESEPKGFILASTSPRAVMLFNNTDFCSIHSATWVGDIPSGEERSTHARMYFMQGELQDFLKREKLDMHKDESLCGETEQTHAQ